jgi:hypothetical protein
MLTEFEGYFAYSAAQIWSFCVGHLTDLVPRHWQHFQILMSQYYTAYRHTEKHYDQYDNMKSCSEEHVSDLIECYLSTYAVIY